MMVEWPDASLQISIPGYLSSPVTFVRKDGYSLFTFSNEALVTIKFNTRITYFVSKCPQKKSSQGGIQLISNMKYNTLNANGIAKDFYYSLFNQYKMSGSISSGILGATLYYSYMNGENIAKGQTTNFSPINVPNLIFTSSLIRNGINSITYKDLNLNVVSSFNPNVPTSIEINWDSLIENGNNYPDNRAYGGNSILSTHISSLLEDIPTPTSYSLTISLDSVLSANSIIEIDTKNGKTIITGTTTFSNSESFTANLYLTYNSCKSKKFQNIIVNKVGVQTVNFTTSDIPKECISTDAYIVSIAFFFPSSYDCAYQINNESLKTYDDKKTIIKNIPFKMNCYAKLKSSSEWIKVKEAPVDQKGETISVQCSDANFPKNYSINIVCDF